MRRKKGRLDNDIISGCILLCGCFCYHRYRGVIQEDGPLRCEGLFEDTFLTQRLLKENRLAISQFLCLRLMCQTINRDGEYIYNAAVIAKLFCLCISVFLPLSLLATRLLT